MHETKQHVHLLRLRSYEIKNIRKSHKQNPVPDETWWRYCKGHLVTLTFKVFYYRLIP